MGLAENALAQGNSVKKEPLFNFQLANLNNDPAQDSKVFFDDASATVRGGWSFQEAAKVGLQGEVQR